MAIQEGVSSVTGQQGRATELLRALLDIRRPCTEGASPEAILDRGAQIVAKTLGGEVRVYEFTDDRTALVDRRGGERLDPSAHPALKEALGRMGEPCGEQAAGGGDGSVCWVALRGCGPPIGALRLRREGELDVAEALFLQEAALLLGDAVERIRIEDDLREQQRRLRTLIHNLPGAVYRAEPGGDWDLCYLSEPIEGITGYERRELLEGRPPFLRLIHEADRARVRDEVERALRERTAFVVTYRIQAKDGEERWVWERGKGVFDSTGEAIALEGILFDVTEERRGARDEERLLQRLQEAVHLRDEFLLVASHELRTPLTPLNIELQRLLRVLPRERRDLVARVDRAFRQVDRLWRITEGMLDVSRIGAGRLQLELDVVDLGDLVREVVETFEEEAARRGVEVRVEAEEGVRGLWDNHRLRQVFENLVSNAIRFGAGRPVDVRVERRGDVARVTVRDRGIGIEPGQLEAIFQRYARAVSFREYGGLGLGLFLTRKLVQAHGGAVWAEHADGYGSTFIVELPWGVC